MARPGLKDIVIQTRRYVLDIRLCGWIQELLLFEDRETVSIWMEFDLLHIISAIGIKPRDNDIRLSLFRHRVMGSMLLASLLFTKRTSTDSSLHWTSLVNGLVMI